MKALVIGPLVSLALLVGTAAPGVASEVGTGSLFLNGRIVGTVVTPSGLPAGTGIDPFYKVTNGAQGQLGIAGVGPGEPGYHGGAWEVFVVTFNPGVTPTLLTSASAVSAAQAAGAVTVTRVPNADFRCPVTQQS